MATAPRSPIVLAAALAALAACGNGAREPEPLRVATAGGGRADLSQTTWQQCRDATPAPGQSEALRLVFGEDGAITYVFTAFTTAACAGTGQVLPPFAGLAFASGDRAVSWSGTPPDGVPATPLATRVFVDFGVGGVAGEVFWMDDTPPGRRLYLSPDGPEFPLDPDGYPASLLAQALAEVL